MKTRTTTNKVYTNSGVQVCKFNVKLNKKNADILAKNLAFEAKAAEKKAAKNAPKAPRTEQSILDELKVKVFKPMYEKYGPTTNRERIQHGFFTTMKENGIHLSKVAYRYLCEQKRNLVARYINYSSKR